MTTARAVRIGRAVDRSGRWSGGGDLRRVRLPPPGCATAELSSAGRGEEDELLDRFMPVFEVAERHHIAVAAPAATTFAAAAEMDLNRSLPVRLIFRAREWVMGSASRQPAAVRGIPSPGQGDRLGRPC